MEIQLCGAIHPDDPTVTCAEPPGFHEFHSTLGIFAIRWRNEEYVIPPRAPLSHQSQTQMMVDIARRADPVRHAPHPNSVRAFERSEPRHGTREAEVLACLRRAKGAWVPGHMLCTAEVGGSEGLRRIRSLREKGWPIENQEPPNGEGTDEYRLIENL